MPADFDDQDIGRPVRAIIVDDEKLGRQLVRQLAEATPLIEIESEHANGQDAISVVKSTRPDAVFLDIKMPGLSGMSVAREILECECFVVFVTAFEAYALEAFEVQAFDYLLKPIELDRFEIVAHRLFDAVRRTRLESFISGGNARSASLTVPEGRPAPVEKRIRIRDGNTIRYVDPGKVIWFEAANQYVLIHALSGNYLVSTESLNSLQRKIDRNSFLRVHRSSIVNINHALHIRVDDRGVYFIEMSNGDRVRVSRSNRGALEGLEL